MISTEELVNDFHQSNRSSVIAGVVSSGTGTGPTQQPDTTAKENLHDHPNHRQTSVSSRSPNMKVQAKYSDGKTAMAEVPDNWLEYLLNHAQLWDSQRFFPTDLDYHIHVVPMSEIRANAKAELSKLRGDYSI